MIKKTSFAFLTYPRSGSRLLRSLLQQQGYFSLIHHDIARVALKPKRPIVSIIREPLDCLTSHISMQRYYEIEETVESQIEYYEIMMQYLIKNAEYITTYDRLMLNPGKTAEDLMDYFNLKYEKVSYDLHITRNNMDKKSLKSSKSYNGYEQVREELLGYNLDECNNLYNAALPKSLI